jgi:hypothetical protein
MVPARRLDSRSGTPDPGTPAEPVERLYRHCLFCGEAFPPNALFGHVPPGSRLTYDPARGRLWSVCARCERWNLLPFEDRYDAIETLERVVTDRAEHLASTENVSLHLYEQLAIIRIGRAPLVERAWWRYGRELTERDARLRRPIVRASSAVLGMLATAGERFGIWKADDGGPSAAIDLLRWQRFGSEAWSGRSRCPYCHSVLRSLRFDVGWWLHPRVEEGELVVGVPCTRCDPWTPRNVFDVTGDDAILVLRRVLAYQHLAGADERRVREATRLIERAGTSAGLVAELSTGHTSLWRLGPTRGLALEIALNAVAERRQLTAQLLGIEARWRAENELADIVDDVLS